MTEAQREWAHEAATYGPDAVEYADEVPSDDTPSHCCEVCRHPGATVYHEDADNPVWLCADDRACNARCREQEGECEAMTWDGVPW